MRRFATLGAAVIALPFALFLPAPATAQPTAPTSTDVREVREVFSPDGTIQKAVITRPADTGAAPRSAVVAAEVITIQNNGPTASRFDLVFVGDGYTAGEQALYGQHVRSKVDELFRVEPFASYRGQFNVWQVNVVSNQSGVDNDPTEGILRDTALDMFFFCGGIARLLCVNETKARQFAAAAPAVDMVLALGNSTTYGGAGGGVATASGGNPSSGQIAIHELGHSIAGLADEYGGAVCGAQSEPPEPNVTLLTAEQMQSQQRKWYRWIGGPSPDGGNVGAFVGGKYCDNIINRPTDNSIMRSLGREFNSPGRETMIASFYRAASTIDSVTPAGPTAPPRATLRVVVARVPGTPQVVWRVDGTVRASGVHSLNLATLNLARGRHTVTVTVTDPTPHIRDEALRPRASRSWTVVVP